MAPKLSALRDEYRRGDLEVVAVYIETCDGVEDPAAALREQVAKHRIDYPALNGEAGTLVDPTGARYPWAPRALLLDAEGRIVRVYAHMGRLEHLRSDLDAAVALGWIPPRPDDPWRGFPANAWVKARTVDGGVARVRTFTRRSVTAEGTRIEVRDEPDVGEPSRSEELRAHARSADARGPYEELDAESWSLGGRTVRCRVFRRSWSRGDRGAGEVRFSELSWIAEGSAPPEILVRRDVTRTAPDGSTSKRTRRLAAIDQVLRVGGRRVPCWIVEETSGAAAGTSLRTWYSRDVPGHVVRRVLRRPGRDAEIVWDVVAFQAD